MNANGVTDRSSRFAYSLIALQGVSLALLFALFYWHLVPGLVEHWRNYENFSHGFVVPIVSVYLIWHKRTELQLLPIRPTLWASIPLGVAISLALVGDTLGNDFTMRLSMVWALGGLVYLLLGKSFMKALAFPILYLVLMIPLPFIVMRELMFNLRVSLSILSENFLRIVGIPVYRDLYFLHLPNITLEVTDGCSGVGSLFVLFALAVVYAYFLPISRTARFFLAASAVPIALFANLFRILVTAALAYHLGPIVLSSAIHLPYGAFNFVMGLGLLILEGEFLRKKSSTPLGAQARHKQMSESTIGSRRILAGWTPFMVGVVIFSVAIWSTRSVRAVPKTIAQVNLAELSSSLARLFPIATLDWVDPYQDPKADTSIASVYFGADQVPVEVFIGYRNAQRGEDRLQSPKLAIPDPWYLAWIKATAIEIKPGAKISANWMLTRKGMSQRLILYWYQLGNRTYGGEFEHRIEQIRRLFLERRSDGAIVRISTSLRNDEPIEAAQKRLQEFAIRLYPELLRVLPL